MSYGASSEGKCAYQDVIKHLGLTYNNKTFHMTRPVADYSVPTYIFMELYVYTILEVREKDQIFVPYVWFTLEWQNDFILWEPDQFCGISNLSVPAELIWKPDLTVEEATENDKSKPNPYVTILFNGTTGIIYNHVLVSTCKMQVFRFPFDTQSCNLTFRSVIHSGEYVTCCIYIKIKRRSALYIVNFILPILFFLCLDLASFLISDTSGEKLGFKVTVLLAVTVMQLILNEILPSSSERIPLIAVYCIGVFALMMLSLLESVFVMHLIEKDNAPQDNETDEDLRLSEDKRGKARCEGEVNKCVHSSSSCDVSPIKTPSEKLPVATEQFGLSQVYTEFTNPPSIKPPVQTSKAVTARLATATTSVSLNQYYLQPHNRSLFFLLLLTTVYETTFQDSNIQLMEVSLALYEVRNQIKTLLLSDRKEEAKPGYWTKVARRINKVFIICYVSAIIVFLVNMFSIWTD
uniref:5-hydroxytryptamine receptor 3A-like n=1 Tax=Solea senegalensis TaxID=28829 RepID=UPI001CD8CD12|nr:5-hydroxytryptamine receptor 3A-like [Solea senegalensis]